MADLETVDILGIEVMATGGPVKAIGSPPGGDFYTRDDLQRMAEAQLELGDEIRAPIKIGHSDLQRLSGVTPGEMPALGWLDSRSFRVEDDPDTGSAKLVADAKAVPAKVADLVKAGAYRARSAEIRKYASQTTQKSYDWVVSGLALLGAQIPAIQTLDDVFRLYEQHGLDEAGQQVTYVIQHAAGAPVWDPSTSLEATRNDLAEALNGSPPYGGEMRFWVRDISPTAALVCEGYDDTDAWVVSFTRTTDGTISVAPSSDWTRAEQTWIATSKEYARKNERAAESRPMELTLTDEQAAQLREKLGVDGDTITPETLVAAAETRANELADAKAKADEAEQRKNEAADATTKLADLEKRFEASERRAFEMERDTEIGDAMKDGRLKPADKEKWEKRYESNPELTKELLSEMDPDPALRREFGSDDDGREGGDDVTREFEADLALSMGVPAEELI